jgi:cytochrome c oxidase assembly factor CtaG
MFHQSDAMPRAAPLWGSRASCGEPQAEQTRTSTSGTGAQRVLKPENGYPRPTRSNGLQRIALVAGVATLVAAQLAPLTDRFWEHMAQHLLIGDVAPLLVVLGGVRARVRPLAALAAWAANIVVWHLTPLYDAALDHAGVHLLQHALFFGCGVLLWSGLLAPFALGWKFAYVGVMWLVSLALAQVFLWSGHSYYDGYSLSDQRAGGGVMLVEGSFVMLGVVVWLLLVALKDDQEPSTPIL